MFIQLKNGVILTNPGQLDPMLASLPAQVVPDRRVVPQQKFIDDMVAHVAHIRQEWLADGVPLSQVEIPVQDMFEEIADLLERMGCKFDRGLIVGDPTHV
jgi:hypothetical protein